MCGIERWDGLSALLILFGQRPGPLAQAGMPAGLWPSIYRDIEIPLPPLAEQRRIVAELDTVSTCDLRAGFGKSEFVAVATHEKSAQNRRTPGI